MSIQNFYQYISFISFGVIFIPFVSLIIRFKTLNITLRVLFLYILISIVTEILSRYGVTIDITVYNAIQNCFTILECICFSVIFYLQFTSRAARATVQVLLALFLLFSAFLLIPGSNFLINNMTILVTESLMMIVFGIAYFFKIYTEDSIQKSDNNFFFWINSGILIYFCASFFLFLFDAHILKLKDEYFSLLQSIHQLANIATTLLFSVAVWKTKTN